MVPVMCLILAFCSQITASSMLHVRDGIYSRISVKISDQVPRQFCQKVIDNIEVRSTEHLILNKNWWNHSLRPNLTLFREEMGRKFDGKMPTQVTTRVPT